MLLRWTLLWPIVAVVTASKIGPRNSDFTTNLANWMSLLPHALRNVPIISLAIPGTHDSFTSDITSNSDLAPDGKAIIEKIGKPRIMWPFGGLMAKWSRTQKYGVVKQLEAGIRFFDLRFCRDEHQKLYFCHGMIGSEVKSVLNSMAYYLRYRPKEVVILDCQHFYNFTADTHTEVIQFLKDTFGSALIPFTSNMNSLTLDYLASQNQQVLVVYRNARNIGQPLLWDSGSLPTPWYNTMDSKQLIGNLTTGLTKRSASSGHVSQLVLTPNPSTIVKNIYSSLLAKCAKNFERERTRWIESQKAGQNGINVIIADFVDLSNNLFSKTVLRLNKKMATENKRFGRL